MNAEIIAVGTELLGPARLDTNSLFLTRELRRWGIRVARKSVVGDDREQIAAAIREALQRAELVLVTGGLGPTADDRTREAAALALDRRLHRDEAMVAQLQRHFARRARPMPESNLRQAEQLEGAAWLPNPLGTAPGQWCAEGASVLVLLPGPGRELHAMFEAELAGRLARWAPRAGIATRVLCTAGVAESEIDALIAPWYASLANPETTVLATAPGIVEVHLLARGDTALEADQIADSSVRALAARLGAHLFTTTGETLPAVVAAWLVRRRQTVAVAESCTGGGLGEALSRVAGASEYFLGGAICYANRLKTELAGVPPPLIEQYGAVSEEVALALAEGIRRQCRSDWGVAVTGIAGPGGGTPEKPVGTVWIGWQGPAGPAQAERHLLPGARDRVRAWSTVAALEALRLALVAGPECESPKPDAVRPRDTR